MLREEYQSEKFYHFSISFPVHTHVGGLLTLLKAKTPTTFSHCVPEFTSHSRLFRRPFAISVVRWLTSCTLYPLPEIPQTNGRWDWDSLWRPYFSCSRKSKIEVESGIKGIWGTHFGGWKTIVNSLFDDAATYWDPSWKTFLIKLDCLLPFERAGVRERYQFTSLQIKRYNIDSRKKPWLINLVEQHSPLLVTLVHSIQCHSSQGYSSTYCHCLWLLKPRPNSRLRAQNHSMWLIRTISMSVPVKVCVKVVWHPHEPWRRC